MPMSQRETERKIQQHENDLMATHGLLGTIAAEQHRHGVRLDSIDGRLDGLDNRLVSVDGKLGELHTSVAEILRRLPEPPV